MPFRTNILSSCKEKVALLSLSLDLHKGALSAKVHAQLDNEIKQLCSSIEAGAGKSTPKAFVQHLNATSDALMRIEEVSAKESQKLAEEFSLVLQEMKNEINRLRIQLKEV